MKRFKVFIYAILAGMSISIGGIAFLSCESKIVGALFFTVGLFMVLNWGFNLYTGKVCYIFENKLGYLVNIPIIWFGNLVGTAVTGYSLRLTRLDIINRAETVCDTKLNDNLISIFILAILCNIMIFVAVDGYNKSQYQIGRYLALFFGVSVFVLCGFEHCVANMFYFSVANAWSLNTLLYLAVMTLGNAVGGVIIPVLRRFNDKNA